ncbi:hypothetical protein J4417_05870, partial [Candidatus Woesearchaeota archaeon]|nr:hypothetical protein [Candidatus Woesearchaeota archaeon]
ISYVESKGFNTSVFFTTGPIEGYTGEIGYQRYLKYEYIRNYVKANNKVLFDYADILSYSDSGSLDTDSWEGHVFPHIHPDNLRDIDWGACSLGMECNVFIAGTEDGDHIGQVGARRLGKAIWVMLAKLSGWEGALGEPSYSTFNGGTTNFSAVANVSQVANVVLEKKELGKIDFAGHTLDFANLDLDRNVVVENNKVGLNSFVLQGLNVSAVLTIYNTGISGTPAILENGQACTHCSLILNNNGNVTFSVQHFSEYSVMGPEDEICSAGYASNISQWNITWFFDKCYRVGNFVNGDYWVVGPVNIVNITPASTDIAGRVMHGSMINPSPANGSSQGYDSIMHQYGSINVNSYVASLNAARPNGMDLSASNPLQVKGNSSLISTISFGVSTRPQTKSAAVLTVLDASPSVDSFRPAYSGNDKEIIYQVSNLNFSKLLKLPLTSGAPTPSSIEYKVAKPWIDHIPSFLARYQHPADNMQDYSRDFSEDESIIALVLNLNYSDEEKKTLLISFVQLGIDNYRNILLGKDLAEGNWVPLEGQNMGRKLPIVFAGLVLSDDKMLSIGVWNSSIPVGNLNPVFQEDLNIFKVFESDVGRAVQGVNAGDGVAETYNPSHVGLPEWGSRHYGPYDDITRDNANWGAEYRHINTMGMLGTALAVNIMGLRDHWKNDLFFDYYDRVVVTEKQMGYWIGYRDQSWGGAINEFIFNMWNTYRDDFGCSWMDINPTIVDGTRKSRYDCNGDYVYDVDCYFVNSCSDYATQRARDYDPCNIGSCGSVVSTCGDLSCNGFENCSTCSVDCGACADTTPPTRSNGRPTGILPIGTTSVNINLTTDETAICRYSTSAGQSYGSMANTFLRNGNLHYYALNGLIAGAYNYYARCNDSYGNFNTNDYLISFSIAADTTAPVISSVVNSSITNRSAIISWQTNENANSRIYYG